MVSKQEFHPSLLPSLQNQRTVLVNQHDVAQQIQLVVSSTLRTETRPQQIPSPVEVGCLGFSSVAT